jgi:hypothetical protein
MDELPADAVVMVNGAGISSGDAVSDGVDAAELFDIKMDELAWLLAFIAPDRFGRFQGTELVQSKATQNRLTVAGETPVSVAICLPVQRWRRSRPISSTTTRGVGCRSRCGREERSCNPSNPSQRYRSTHFRTVRGQTPAASATASGVCPLSTLSYNPLSTARREPGILVHVHPVLPRIAEASQLQLPRSGPGGQPNESSQLDLHVSDAIGRS